MNFAKIWTIGSKYIMVSNQTLNMDPQNRAGQLASR